MMQRKNKSRSSAVVHGHGSNTSSGYESSSSSSAGALNDRLHHGATSSLQPLPSVTAAAAAASMMIPSSAATSTSIMDDDNLRNSNNNTKPLISEKAKIATVKRHTCGTRPFDYYWLNLDCCGLICASLTYMLHLYAIYSFGWILLPPWFSVMDEDGYRYLTLGCHLHRLLFIGIAFLAIFSHFKAMTTDPGAVPPDAYPLSEKEDAKEKGDWEYEELDTLIKGEVLHHNHHPHHQSLPQQHQHFSQQQQQQQQQQQPAAISVGTLNNNHVEGEYVAGDEKCNSISGASRRREQPSTSSLLMQEDPEMLDNANDANTKWNNIGLPQAATATATAAVVATAAMTTGGLAMVGVAAMAGAGVGAGVDVVGAGMGRTSNNGNSTAGLAEGGREAWEEQPLGNGNESYIHSPSSLQQQQQRGRRMCRRCHAFKPPRAHHCSICKRCIIKMDHHCPWVNNCVGIGNHKYFLLFIFYTSISCAYSFLLLIYRFCHCVGKSSTHHHYHGPRCVDHPNDLLPLVGLTVEALLFGLFTICMMADQWDVVMTNLTHIDRLKGNHNQHHHHGLQQHQRQHADAYGKLPAYYHQHVGNPMSIMRAGINEVFGTVRHAAVSSSTSTLFPRSKFHYTWLSPLHKVCFPENVRDDIFGYCRPCSSATSSSAGSLSRSGTISSCQNMEMVGRGEKARWEDIAQIV